MAIDDGTLNHSFPLLFKHTNDEENFLQDIVSRPFLSRRLRQQKSRSKLDGGLARRGYT
jgi:hypothetical protein